MTQELERASDGQLLRNRLDLLRRDCETCDRGLDRGWCSCYEDLEEILAIEQELRRRGIEF